MLPSPAAANAPIVAGVTLPPDPPPPEPPLEHEANTKGVNMVEANNKRRVDE